MALPYAWLALGLLAPVPGTQEGAAPASTGVLHEVLKERAGELDPREWGVGERVPDLAFRTAGAPAGDGREGHLSDYADAPALVIAIRQIGCPVGDRYGPRLARLEAEYAHRGVDFLYVCMDKFLEPEEVFEQEIERYGFQGRYVHDPDETFGRALGTETTTAVYVLDAARTLRYRGAVDDQIGRGVLLDQPSREYLREALDAVLARREVEIQATSAPGCLLDIEREVAPTPPEEITYHREVARILQSDCTRCHHEGGPAPFSLQGYRQAYDKRRMIGMVTRERIMPPWYAAEDDGRWKHDARLTERELSTLQAWIENDAPEGDPAETPVPIEWPNGWLIGEPDLIFRLDREYPIPAEGTIQWEPIAGDRVAPEDLWIQRIQILPTDPTVVHHVLMFFQPPADYGLDVRNRVMDTLSPFEPRPQPTWQFLAGHVPGSGPRQFPPGTARFIPKGSRLRFDMHYTPNGRPTSDRTMLGLVLADEPPRLVSRMRAVQNFRLFIPAHGKADYEGSLTFDEEVLVRSINPHMHLRGVEFLAHVIYPDGREWEMIHLPVWDPDWQLSYYFAEPPILPAGSTIRIHGWFDNTSSNPHNPDPSSDVRGGKQNEDEMLYMAVDCIQPRDVVEHAYGQRGGGVVDHPLHMD